MNTPNILPEAQPAAAPISGRAASSAAPPSLLPSLPQPPDTPSQKHRNVLQLGTGVSGTRALEAVTEQLGDTTRLYYQVTSGGQEVLQSICLTEAKKHYDSLK